MSGLKRLLNPVAKSLTATLVSALSNKPNILEEINPFAVTHNGEIVTHNGVPVTSMEAI